MSSTARSPDVLIICRECLQPRVHYGRRLCRNCFEMLENRDMRRPVDPQEHTAGIPNSPRGRKRKRTK